MRVVEKFARREKGRKWAGGRLFEHDELTILSRLRALDQGLRAGRHPGLLELVYRATPHIQLTESWGGIGDLEVGTLKR